MTSNALAGLDVYLDSDSDSNNAEASDSVQNVAGDSVTQTIALIDLTTKPVVGEWLCYCFIDISIPDQLHELIDRAHAMAKDLLSSDYPYTDCLAIDREDASSVLHISLTRPITVRAHERDEFVRVASIAADTCNVQNNLVAFSRFTHLQNDDATRDFLVLEVGTGRNWLLALTRALGSRLHSAFRARPYHEEARFHASTGYIQLPSPTPLPLKDVVLELEENLGDQLRASPRVPARRIGIQVGSSITYVAL